jgi:hypothetical protein
MSSISKQMLGWMIRDIDFERHILCKIVVRKRMPAKSEDEILDKLGRIYGYAMFYAWV